MPWAATHLHGSLRRPHPGLIACAEAHAAEMLLALLAAEDEARDNLVHIGPFSASAMRPRWHRDGCAVAASVVLYPSIRAKRPVASGPRLNFPFLSGSFSCPPAVGCLMGARYLARTQL